jgi:hypothetical protein
VFWPESPGFGRGSGPWARPWARLAPAWPGVGSTDWPRHGRHRCGRSRALVNVSPKCGFLYQNHVSGSLSTQGLALTLAWPGLSIWAQLDRSGTPMLGSPVTFPTAFRMGICRLHQDFSSRTMFI